MKKKQKNFGGRPRKSDSERRTAKLDFVRVSKTEIQHIEKQAEMANVLVSEWVRQRLGLGSTGYGE